MKKEYLEPQLEVIKITEQEFLAFSGGGDAGDPLVDPTPDPDSGDNLAPLFLDDSMMLL